MNLNEKELESTNNQNKKFNFLTFLSHSHKVLSFISTILFIVFLIFCIFAFKKSFPNNVDADVLKQQYLVQENSLTLDDFVGYKDIKEEMRKLVDFANGTIDESSVERGILFYGPPGTGKTFLVKCLAGSVKDKASFYSLSASSLQSKYVGVGAEQIRTVFDMAKKDARLQNQKTYFVFIDEIDVIGKKRSSSNMRRNDDSDSILNELLVQLDGFNANQKPDDPKLVFLAATNREDLLDEALTRSGRLGKRIKIDYPDVAMIKQIIDHFILNNKNNTSEYIKKIFDSFTDRQQEIENLSKRMHQFRFTAAKIVSFFKELNNLISEMNVKEFNQKITDKDNRYFIDKIYDALEIATLGPKNSSSMTSEDVDKIICHELGHAFFAWNNNYQVYRISLEQRSNIKGYTVCFPKTDNVLKTKKDILNEIKVFLGGRCFEQLCYGFDDYTIGAVNDFEKAYNMAHVMVTQLGMTINQKQIEALKQELKNRYTNTSAVLTLNEDFNNIILYDRDNYLQIQNTEIQNSIVEIIKFCYYSNMIDFYDAINGKQYVSTFMNNIKENCLISDSFREQLLEQPTIIEIRRNKGKINNKDIEDIFQKFFIKK